MRLIINCAALSSTGPVQVALSFIKECIANTENQYLVFISPTIRSLIDPNIYPDNFQFVVVEKHPAKGIQGIRSRRIMRRYESIFRPNCVFTVFGPSVWKPHVPHLQGFAYGHYIYRDSPAFSLMSWKERVYRSMLKKAHLYHLKRDGDYFVCETDDVTERLQKLLNLNSGHCFTVTNTYSHYFSFFVPNDNHIIPGCNGKSVFRYLLLSSAHPHKHLTILNEIIPILNSRELPFSIRFVVTIPNELYNTLFSDEVKKYVDNIGPVKPKDCPQVYYETDALFAPTLLECFSANYPEAMVMERPIITTDLPFAHSICDDAAIYFSPLNAEDATNKIIYLATNKDVKEDLVKKGKNRLSYFCSPAERADKYLEICKNISN